VGAAPTAARRVAAPRRTVAALATEDTPAVIKVRESVVACV
jgi:hypothetical protein